MVERGKSRKGVIQKPKSGAFVILKRYIYIMKCIMNFIKGLFYLKCNKCKFGRIKHDHSELIIGGVWIEVYECDYCKSQYV